MPNALACFIKPVVLYRLKIKSRIPEKTFYFWFFCFVWEKVEVCYWEQAAGKTVNR